MAITSTPGGAAAEPDRGPARSTPIVDRGHVHPASSEAYRGQAGRYDRRTEAFQPWRERLVEQLPARAGDTVLDVGCGTGLCLPMLQDKVGSTGTIVGIDASEQMLQMAADRVATPGAGTTSGCWRLRSSGHRSTPPRTLPCSAQCTMCCNPGPR